MNNLKKLKQRVGEQQQVVGKVRGFLPNSTMRATTVVADAPLTRLPRPVVTSDVMPNRSRHNRRETLLLWCALGLCTYQGPAQAARVGPIEQMEADRAFKQATG